MNIAGIVAEYNPFHLGHAHHIAETRRILGEDCVVVCAMSGDFVQRGEPALYSKYARSEAAVRCGADLVLELPVHVSVSSAERFAQGAVELLGRLGVVTHLSFGSESGDVAALERVAAATESKEFHELVKVYLETGCSYPVARSAALKKILGSADFTRTANDNLGIEYIRAIQKFGFDITPVAIKRCGAMHDAYADGNMKSGSELRSIVKSGANIFDYVPDAAYAIYQRETDAGRGPVFPESLELPILSRLRMLPDQSFSKLPDASEGLEMKLQNACRTRINLNEIYDTVKSKRYTHARIRRMTMGAALRITKSDYEKDNCYARVLALNERGGKVLRTAQDCGNVDILSKPSAARELSKEQLDTFIKTADAHDLYVLGYPEPTERVGEADWITSPVFVR